MCKPWPIVVRTEIWVQCQQNKWNIDHCTWKGEAFVLSKAEVEDSLTRKPLSPGFIGEMCLHLPHQHRKLPSPLVFRQCPDAEPLISPALIQ